MTLIGFLYLNREDLEDRKENIFGSFSYRAIRTVDVIHPAHDLA